VDRHSPGLRDAIVKVNPDRLAALCITHQRETFVPMDEKGAMRNAIVWMDERSRSVLPDLDTCMAVLASIN